MRNVLLWSVIAILALTIGGVASAQVRSWDDLDWWAQSGAGPDPVKASVHPGYWWWPVEAQSNADDGELWGNRGVVYSMFTPGPPPPPPPPPVQTPPPPAPTPAPTAERSVPVFNSVLFDFDKSIVKEAGRTEIGKVAGLLKEYSGDTITVNGYTCDLNRSGDPDYNTKLAQRRADAVKAVLISNGISASRITTASHGEMHPAVPNTSDENRELNRRVVFVYKLSD